MGVSEERNLHFGVESDELGYEWLVVQGTGVPRKFRTMQSAQSAATRESGGFLALHGWFQPEIPEMGLYPAEYAASGA